MSRVEENQQSSEIQRSWKITEANDGDLDSLWEVINKCSLWLLDKGHDHWVQYYSKELIHKKLAGQHVYVLREGGRLIGTVTTDTKEVEYYTSDDMAAFEDPDATALYVTALAVLPAEQGKGYASQIMEFVEAQAREQNISYIRFDCRARYIELVRFYEHRGYKVKGLLWDEEDNNEPYCLMEKRISSRD